ncbi:MAG TPA: methyltransferase domain-containing protein [Candidatus Doudnabacteria bacterium]|nr:methyltransferase domain-containing protein [Candidatus Doudnabacteria bacterium]
MKFETSKDSYSAPEGAENYLKFLASPDGGFFQEVLFEAFRGRLSEDKNQKILDAACGPGWLTAKLAEEFPNIQGLDASGPFLEHARNRYPDLKFVEGDLNGSLPYPDNEFDTIIMSMAAHDVEDQVKTFTELKRILKPNGQFLLTFVNPYYAFPVGVWKRGWLGRLLFKNPKLQVSPYHWFAQKQRGFTFYDNLECYFYKLSEHLNHLREAGFNFEFMRELESLQDSDRYNLQYRLHRFPIFLLVEFKKV